MAAPIRDRILATLRRRGVLRVADIVAASQLSRAYIHRLFNALESEGRIVRIGKANRARYVAGTRGALARARSAELKFRRILRADSFVEDELLAEVRRETGIFSRLPRNVSDILDYAFSEMVNNALEHARARTIDVRVERMPHRVTFRVRDDGVGIFHNIMRMRGLHSESEAVQDLLKGKLTTQPERHSGEGIFFTSRVVDLMVIRGSKKKLIFDNRLGDIFVREVTPLVGTQVDVMVGHPSKRTLRSVFDRFAGRNYAFDKTSVRVRLFEGAGGYVSRSQARRLLAGLGQFRSIILEFAGVKLVGQGFADEVFNIWQAAHPDIRLEVHGANEDVSLMIARARQRKNGGS